MDEYTRAELKEFGKLCFAIIVIPCLLATIIFGLLYLWIPAGVAFVALIISGAIIGSISRGAEQRRRDAERFGRK